MRDVGFCIVEKLDFFYAHARLDLDARSEVVEEDKAEFTTSLYTCLFSFSIWALCRSDVLQLYVKRTGTHDGSCIVTSLNCVYIKTNALAVSVCHH